MFVISHDRYFINKTATRVIELCKDGVNFYNGNYDYYLSQKRLSTPNEANSVLKKEAKKPNDYKLKKELASSLRKMKTEMNRTEAEIEETEGKISECETKLADPELQSDYEKLIETTNMLEELNSKLEELYNKWDTVHTKIEDAERIVSI